MSEIIEFNGKSAKPKKSCKHRKTEPSPNNIMKELRRKFPKCKKVDPEHEALDKLINLAVQKKLDKGEASTRFDAILTLIQEEALKLSRLSTSSNSKDEMADTIEDMTKLLNSLELELRFEPRSTSSAADYYPF